MADVDPDAAGTLMDVMEEARQSDIESANGCIRPDAGWPDADGRRYNRKRSMHSIE